MKLVLAFMMAALLSAQDQRETRIFQLKHAQANELAHALGLYAGAQVRDNNSLRTISVEAPAAVMRQIEEAIKRFDVPPPPAQNVEVTVYVLTTAPEGAGQAPPELEGVAKQLRATFGYKNIRLLDVQVIRARAGRGGDVSGTVGSGIPQTIANYRFARATIGTDEKGRTIRLDGLRLGLKVPIVGAGGAVQYTDTGIGTDIDVREGQKAVVGKTVAESAEKASLFVVMAKVVE